MRTIQVTSRVLVVLFVGLTQCSEEEAASSFDERLVQVKAMSKTISSILKETVTVGSIKTAKSLGFDQDLALSKAKTALLANGYEPFSSSQITTVNL